MDELSELKRLLKEYRDADDKLRALNDEITKLKESRKQSEFIITDILSKPAYATFDKLKLEDDGSTIRVQRPTQWNKPWTLSKTNLYNYLKQYFAITQGTDADTCYSYIEQQHKRQLVATEFSLTRVLPKDVWK